MKIHFQPKKLPAPLALLILLAISTGGILLIQRIRTLNTRVAAETSPRQVKITNIGSYSFTVSWITQDKTTGLLEFGESASLGQLKKDQRDLDLSTSAKYQTHYVVVDNLKSETKYYFRIISSGISYLNDKKAFEVTTGSPKVPNDNDLAQGKILTSNKEPALGAIVYLSITSAITQSALVDSDGGWMIPLSTARSTDLQDFSNYDRNAQVEEIFVQSDSETASATLTTGNDNPTPDIILGQTYNFLGQLPQITNTPSPIRQTFGEGLSSPTSSSSGFSNLGESSDLTITFPAESEKVNSSVPEFLGTGPQGQKLDVKIESEEQISSQITPDPKGKWKYTPGSTLSPGPHTITVSYTDNNGFLRKISRFFIVLATGASDLPSFTATPSGQTTTPTPRLSPSPTPSPTRVPGVTITQTPTLSPIASPSSALILTATPTQQYRTTLPSTESGTPKPGSILPTKLFLGAGLAAILVGAILILF